MSGWGTSDELLLREVDEAHSNSGRKHTVLWASNTHRESTALLASIPLFGKRLCHFVAWFEFGLGFWTRSKPRLLVVLEVEAKEIGAGTDL